MLLLILSFWLCLHYAAAAPVPDAGAVACIACIQKHMQQKAM
jgi:hypothetical protein